MNRITKIVVAGGLALVMAVTVLGAGLVVSVASAQTPTPGAESGTATSLGENFWQFLADRLGVTLEQLVQAVRDAGRDTTAQGVTDGVLTQEQADTMNERLETWQPGQGGLPFGKGFGHGHGHGLGMLGGSAMLDAAADALGLTTAELMTELQSGQTLADIADAQGVSEDAVKQAMVDAAKSKVDQAVTDGRITQAQADEIKARIDDMAANLDLSQPFFFGRGGFHHGHGFWGAPPLAPDADDDAS
jgi:hypothetical protein